MTTKSKSWIVFAVVFLIGAFVERFTKLTEKVIKP